MQYSQQFICYIWEVSGCHLITDQLIFGSNRKKYHDQLEICTLDLEEEMKAVIPHICQFHLHIIKCIIIVPP